MVYTLHFLVGMSCVLLAYSFPQYGSEHHQEHQEHQIEYHQPQHEIHEPQHHQEHIQPKHIHIPILAQKQETYKGGYQFSYKSGNGIYQEETGYLKKVPADKDYHGEKHGEHEEEAIVMQGKISYTGADGKPYTLTYIADENGFQPQGDHLPTPPPAPHHGDGHGHQQLEVHHGHEASSHQIQQGGDLQKHVQEYDEGYGQYGYH